MESSAVAVVSPLSLNHQLSFIFPSKPRRGKANFGPCWSSKPRAYRPTRLRCQQMYVPGFGEASPEKKAANNLHSFFTYIAVRIVAAQLQSYNPEAYEELMEFLSRNSLNDGDKFCASLMRESSRHKGLGK
ncbi:Chaperonin-like [Parasponia andersonii]|uniref:Chaperonin-like n=1 Tax=Parasponia andersonii TaxID=3476 RepID=A0A2P5BTK8_PARAD|nr:Chaperonin-like [Parasponia andersonii]